MLTFKEALCLLAIVVAYGITGRMDFEDALLMEQVRQDVGANCVLLLASDDGPQDAGSTEHPAAIRPTEGTRPDEPCNSSTAPDQPVRLPRH